MVVLEQILGQWYPLLKDEFSKPYILELNKRIKAIRAKVAVYPPSQDVLNAYSLTPPSQVKVVIIGQDPYHTENLAHGLAFSIIDNIGKKTPPSLINIFKEIEDDIGFQVRHNPNLTRWAKQGVLLLNTCLTVEKGRPNSHNNWGWEIFTTRTVEILASLPQPIVFLLWGRHAEKFMKVIPEHPSKHIIVSAHPSPFSAHRGFFGTKPFSRANKWLISQNQMPIDWLKD